mmetsp:Transcript_83122/g.217050  ORF Transcript_83122/g.217050 Transcript_83122/m.217050 type:complete len:232 (-) Transcript_83122:852-1547(-)
MSLRLERCLGRPERGLCLGGRLLPRAARQGSRGLQVHEDGDGLREDAHGEGRVLQLGIDQLLLLGRAIQRLLGTLSDGKDARVQLAHLFLELRLRLQVRVDLRRELPDGGLREAQRQLVLRLLLCAPLALVRALLLPRPQLGQRLSDLRPQFAVILLLHRGRRRGLWRGGRGLLAHPREARWKLGGRARRPREDRQHVLLGAGGLRLRPELHEAGRFHEYILRLPARRRGV